MPQFVILHHRLPPESSRADHYDLMLESAETLLTWAVLEIPNGESQTAESLPPHRRDYLTYEGAVSENRGDVKRIAAGEFEWIVRDESELIVELTSPQISGRLMLQQRAGQWWVWLKLSGS